MLCLRRWWYGTHPPLLFKNKQDHVCPSNDSNPKAWPAQWWITADYWTDTFIWSASSVILSSLTLHPNPRLCSHTNPWLKTNLRQRRKEWNILCLNLKPFVCCCLYLECARGWAAEKLQRVCVSAHALCTPLPLRHTHTLLHTESESIINLLASLCLSFF